jgi:carbonic anhydrase
MNGNEALERLLEGNRRYVNAQAHHPRQTAEHRVSLTKGQSPFAVVLGCADSRIPPEILFDQGLGDIFVIRVAGHVVDNSVLGSLEYAVEHLGVPLLLVLGHESCGAVSAAIQNDSLPGNLDHVVKAIQPAVEQAIPGDGDVVEQVIKTHVDLVVRQLQNSPSVLARYVNDDRLCIMGAYYHLTSGAVSPFIPDMG